MVSRKIRNRKLSSPQRTYVRGRKVRDPLISFQNLLGKKLSTSGATPAPSPACSWRLRTLSNIVRGGEGWYLASRCETIMGDISGYIMKTLMSYLGCCTSPGHKSAFPNVALRNALVRSRSFPFVEGRDTRMRQSFPAFAIETFLICYLFCSLPHCGRSRAASDWRSSKNALHSSRLSTQHRTALGAANAI